MRTIRLLLVDDHVLFRESLSRLLAAQTGFEIAGSCGNIAEALPILKREPIDIVLLDFDLGDDHGSAFIDEARRAGFRGKFLMVTAGMDAVESSTVLTLGVSGIFHKHNPPGTLTKAIEQVAGGEMWVDQGTIQLLADKVPRRAETVRPNLTEREQSVLRGIFEGLSNKEIAGQLGVSESAIKATLQQLFHKTGVRTRSQLVRIALEGALAPRPR